MSLPACIVPAGDRCGEGPVWHAAEQALFWTDINRFLIHRYDARERSVKSWFFEEPVTSLALTDSEGVLLVALGSCVILWEPWSDVRSEPIFRLPGWPHARLNDGGPDPGGAFWVGSMRNNVHPDGSPGEAGGNDGILFSVRANGDAKEWKHGIGISNTVSWSPDGSRFYFGDTLANAIYVYDFDAGSGTIANERPFFADFPRGKPDGSVVDSEGFLWNCRYGGGCVVRISPEGQINRIIEMPTKNPTNCTFGGVNLRTLFVTTASEPNLLGDRFMGGLFAVECDIDGLPENRFCLSDALRRRFRTGLP